MNRLIVERKSRITVENGSILVDSQRFPISSIDRLYINAQVDMSLQDLSKLSKKDISIVIISNRPKEFIHIQKHYAKNGDLKLKQYQALSKRVDIARYLVQQKIGSAKKMLKEFELDIEERQYLKNLQTATTIETILGIEGSFSREYFKRYFSLFPKILSKGYRSKQPPLDPVNAMLSFVYTIFYYEIASQLHIFGYEPTISYLHTPFREHLALSSDLLELFRATIDKFVANLFLEKKLTHKDFFKKGGVYIKPNSKKELWKELKPFIEKKEQEILTQISELKKMIEKSLSNHDTLS